MGRTVPALPEICVEDAWSITTGSFRDMGRLIRACAGLAIALTILNGEGFWARLQTPALVTAKADIAAQRPGAALKTSLDGWLSRNRTPLVQNPHRARARHLQFRF